MSGRRFYEALIERLRKRATVASLEHHYGLESDLSDAANAIASLCRQTFEDTEAGEHPLRGGE